MASFAEEFLRSKTQKMISYVKILVQEQTLLGNAASQWHVDKGDCGISLELLKCILIHIYLTCQ